MRTVKAKFQCNSIEDFGHSKTAKLSAVYSDKGENADFCKATPSGSLSIGISSDVPASDFFEPNKSYYLEFTEAE